MPRHHERSRRLQWACVACVLGLVSSIAPARAWGQQAEGGEGNLGPGRLLERAGSDEPSARRDNANAEADDDASDEVIEAREQVELLEAGLAARMHAVKIAELNAKHAQERVPQLKRLVAEGSFSSTEFLQAELNAQVKAEELAAAKTSLAEPMILLKHAKRKLARLEKRAHKEQQKDEDNPPAEEANDEPQLIMHGTPHTHGTGMRGPAPAMSGPSPTQMMMGGMGGPQHSGMMMAGMGGAQEGSSNAQHPGMGMGMGGMGMGMPGGGGAPFAALNARLGDIDQKLGRLIAELEGMKHAHEAMRHDHEELLRTHEALRHEHERLNHAHESLRHEHEELEHRHRGLQHEHEGLKHRHEGLRHEHEGLERSHQDLRRQHENLRHQHESLRRRHDGEERGRDRDRDRERETEDEPRERERGRDRQGER